MPDRDPEPWESAAAEPFLRIGDVEVWALADDRFKVTAPGHEEIVHGFEYARERARMLAGELQ